MRIQDFRGLCTLLVLSAVFAAAAPENRDLAGEYVCASMGSRPCDSSTELQLTENGNWRWGRYSGTYTSYRGSVTFDGVGGLATWGPAEAGSAALTFLSGGQEVVWRKLSAGTAGLTPGMYYCRTAPGGCKTAKGIEVAPDGTWSWGASGGSYSIAGGRAIFHGPQVGGWGPADIGDHKVVFHSREGDSEWSAEPPRGIARRAHLDPGSFDLACPLAPFDRQRVMSTIQEAIAPAASDLTKANAHQQLADLCRKSGDSQRAEEESSKAQYWRNGGR